MSARLLPSLTAPIQYKCIDLARYIRYNAPEMVKDVRDDILCQEIYNCLTKPGMVGYYYVAENGELGGIVTGYSVSPTIIHISCLVATHPMGMRECCNYIRYNFPFRTIRYFRREKLVYQNDEERFLDKLSKRQTL